MCLVLVGALALAACSGTPKPKPMPLETVTPQIGGRQVWSARVDSVKFPAVAKGQGRLRVILNACHTHEQIDRLVGVFEAHRALLPSAHAGTHG